jgi:hypothetical protein
MTGDGMLLDRTNTSILGLRSFADQRRNQVLRGLHAKLKMLFREPSRMKQAAAIDALTLTYEVEAVKVFSDGLKDAFDLATNSDPGKRRRARFTIEAAMLKHLPAPLLPWYWAWVVRTITHKEDRPYSPWDTQYFSEAFDEILNQRLSVEDVVKVSSEWYQHWFNSKIEDRLKRDSTPLEERLHEVFDALRREGGGPLEIEELKREYAHLKADFRQFEEIDKVHNAEARSFLSRIERRILTMYFPDETWRAFSKQIGDVYTKWDALKDSFLA